MRWSSTSPSLCVYHSPYIYYTQPFTCLSNAIGISQDYIAVSGSHDRNVLEYVDNLHEHFKYPVSLTSTGSYTVPVDAVGGYSIEMFGESIADYAFRESLCGSIYSLLEIGAEAFGIYSEWGLLGSGV